MIRGSCVVLALWLVCAPARAMNGVHEGRYRVVLSEGTVAAEVFRGFACTQSVTATSAWSSRRRQRHCGWRAIRAWPPSKSESATDARDVTRMRWHRGRPAGMHLTERATSPFLQQLWSWCLHDRRAKAVLFGWRLFMTSRRLRTVAALVNVVAIPLYSLGLFFFGRQASRGSDAAWASGAFIGLLMAAAWMKTPRIAAVLQLMLGSWILIGLAANSEERLVVTSYRLTASDLLPLSVVVVTIAAIAVAVAVSIRTLRRPSVTSDDTKSRE
jgi:hypothetical protein